MAKNSWLEARGYRPAAAGNYEFIWVNFNDNCVELVKCGEDCDWGEITHWQPTQIRTPKLLIT